MQLHVEVAVPAAVLRGQQPRQPLELPRQGPRPRPPCHPCPRAVVVIGRPPVAGLLGLPFGAKADLILWGNVPITFLRGRMIDLRDPVAKQWGSQRLSRSPPCTGGGRGAAPGPRGSRRACGPSAGSASSRVALASLPIPPCLGLFRPPPVAARAWRMSRTVCIRGLTFPARGTPGSRWGAVSALACGPPGARSDAQDGPGPPARPTPDAR